MIDLDTDTAARALGVAPRTARAVLSRIAARTGRAGAASSGGRPARTVPAEDLAAYYGLDARDVIDAAALSA